MRRFLHFLIIFVGLFLLLGRCSHAAAANTRSEAVKNAFAKLQACPGTARNALPCPGYVIDDKTALDCGGQDVVGNKQWLTIEAGKAKDKWERSVPGCKHPTKALPPA